MLAELGLHVEVLQIQAFPLPRRIGEVAQGETHVAAVHRGDERAEQRLRAPAVLCDLLRRQNGLLGLLFVRRAP
jgi:hypothetical protein